MTHVSISSHIRSIDEHNEMTNYLDSYKSIFLDVALRDFWTVRSLIVNEEKLPSSRELSNDLIKFWSERNHQSEHVYLPLLCVRTGFDLFLRSQNFPPQSEIIMSAINIPSMIVLVQYHQLTVIPCDIDRETLTMNVNDLRKLITSKTVAIVFAHVYGRCVDVNEFVDLAYEKNLFFIEDCAESFAGFCSCENSSVEMFCPSRRYNKRPASCYLGHPRSHLVLFSFGVLKFCTAFGGGMAKFADHKLFHEMSKIYSNDPIQNVQQYASNVRKYFFLFWLLNVPHVIKPLMYLVRLFRLNHMEYVVHRLRAFEKSVSREEILSSLRRQPCRALLAFLRHRFENYQSKHLQIQREKAIYVLDRLVKNSSLQLIGMKCPIRNFWLFPIVVSKADLFVRLLSRVHIDAYRGTTQLNVITNVLTDTENLPQPIGHCPNAENLIENVIYLPVHCNVPEHVLDQLINHVNRIAKQLEEYSLKSKL